jgi:hypothetical protein
LWRSRKGSILKTVRGCGKISAVGGILFQVEPPLPVEPGQVREFAFFLVPERGEQRDLEHFHAQGLVLRIDPPAPNSPAYGVAVQFFAALTKKDVTIKMTISPRPCEGTQAKPVRDKP